METLVRPKQNGCRASPVPCAERGKRKRRTAGAHATLPQPGNVGCEGVQRQSPGAVNELIGSSGSAARCGILLRSWGRFLDMELRRPF